MSNLRYPFTPEEEQLIVTLINDNLGCLKSAFKIAERQLNHSSKSISNYYYRKLRYNTEFFKLPKVPTNTKVVKQQESTDYTSQLIELVNNYKALQEENKRLITIINSIKQLL